MFCKNCGTEMNDIQAVCLNCGVKKGDGLRFCANCGKELTYGTRFCSGCGAPTGAPNPNYLAGNEMILIALLCFFLGGIGIHNFIMGETKKGIAKIVLTFGGILLCGIPTIACEVLVIIEFVKILTEKYVVDTEKLF